MTSDRDLSGAKAKLNGERASAMSTIGAEWLPMRDKIESAVVSSAASPYKGDFVDPRIATWSFHGQPGIYFRVRAAEASDIAAIRKLAPDAKKDAFAACLLREPNDRAARGEPDSGAFAEQPWNLSEAYRAAHVLTEDWSNEVREAPDLLHLRVFEQQYEAALKDQLPILARVVKTARFVLLAIDEDVHDASAQAALSAADGGGAMTEEILQTIVHPTRVSLVDLQTGHEMARLRRSGQASFVAAGERMVTDPDARAAMQRQVNNCNLAQQVEAAIAPAAPAPATPPSAAPSSAHN